MRKNLGKLVEHINSFNPNCTEESPEYKLMDQLMSDEMVDLALTMGLRKVESLDSIAERNNLPLDKVRELVHQMTEIGVMEFREVDGKEGAILPLFTPGIFMLMMMKVDQSTLHPEIAQSFVDFIEGFKGNAKFFGRHSGMILAIPVEKAIEAEPERKDFEQVSFFVEKYAPSIAVGHCSCRLIGKQLGKAGEDVETEWCITLGEYAESAIRTGRARRLTKEETYDLLRRAEEKGFVHEVSNSEGPRNSHFICNCNHEICLGIRMAKLVDTPNMLRSNFAASVNPDKCTACGQCVEVCPMNCVKLGQNLCQENPVAIKAPISPDDHPWNIEEHYQPDYENKRTNVVPETGTSPCKTECPAHISVQGYIKLAGQGRYLEALELIKKENPFPAVCGRICPRNCEQACTRCELDEPVAVDEIKKFIADQELTSGKRFVPNKQFKEGHKIAIIGAGPAGLSCAYYLAVYGHSVTVFEKQERLGGMLRFGIPSFRLEKDVIEAEIDVLRELGVTFQTGVEVGRDITIDALRKQGYKGFFLAIGAQAGRKLGIEGENAEGVYSGVDFLREVELQTAKRLDGDVIVVGGGNVAIDVARTAIRYGAKNLNMFCLESEKEMPALPDEIEEATNEGIKINNGWGPKRILVENGRVVGVEFKRCVSVFDAEQRFNPQYDETDTRTVKANAVLISIGQSIAWGDMLSDTNVTLNRNGTIMADDFTYQTSDPDIFAGGDVYTGPKFAIDAIAAGKQGAVSLHRHVWEGHDLYVGRDRRIYKAIDKSNLLIGDYDTTPRQRPVLKKAAAFMTLSDDRLGLNEAQVKKETQRCLGCGSAVVDETRCLGCGVCTVRCKFDAITLRKVANAEGTDYDVLPQRFYSDMMTRAEKIGVTAVKETFEKAQRDGVTYADLPQTFSAAIVEAFEKE